MSTSAVSGSAVSGSSTVVAGVELGDAELAATVRNGLEEVEKLLIAELSDGEDFLQDAALHLAKAGGKRFRPLFTILTGQLGPRPTDPALITAGTVVELVHLATLYHDDVMDEATMRRGAPSVNSRWGNNIAILAGDYLFAHASRLTSTLGPDAVRIIAETFAELVTGQMRETMGARESQDPVEHYLRVVWEKTGSLIAAAGRFGGTFSGADTAHIERLARLGDAVGTAFQISDDIIDISSASEQSGKTPGTDLREGVHTLPVLYALREEGAEADRLRTLLDHPLHSDDEVAEALELLGRSQGMVLAKEKLQSYADQAYAELAALPSGPANDALEQLVRYTIERVG
ncbi:MULTISPECIES: polyprenyl synthetase family protein [Nocardia]|uniref:Heptaprenyl diphosphate synthase component 2 n=3 Tax=Nocardia TaxID=1817 RepID=A0A0H5PHV7_NOCFR|nr:MULTISPECIES: polyprenyl synthetase family protein [Nocardia]AXK87608.1 polyprenyl synthetase family protein [Nocardia farcinica]MCZ9325769.1 polyprenyl synthetase family protein [Nocardia farcinica]PEH77872.1 polyprenyl synthetase family protein [Nocardia sp. FDAARGOS_372]PFX02971.1 Heptaprenyl diphosphate synthase component 2 [Nocardia farcinica]PFX05787.1 Heptaprenyl diphosphate synthase component 2 [Nocardia farcinica]